MESLAISEADRKEVETIISNNETIKIRYALMAAVRDERYWGGMRGYEDGEVCFNGKDAVHYAKDLKFIEVQTNPEGKQTLMLEDSSRISKLPIKLSLRQAFESLETYKSGFNLELISDEEEWSKMKESEGKKIVVLSAAFKAAGLNPEDGRFEKEVDKRIGEQQRGLMDRVRDFYVVGP